MMDKRPIGVFDSGVGGLTVVKALLKTLPNEDIIYLGDTARVPYGTKSKETVTRFSLECVGFLKIFNIKLAVVACNTVSSGSLQTLKKSFDFPVMGVIKPGVKEALANTRNNRIGVIGTKATVRSSAYEKELKRLNRKAMVFQKACPLFVPLAEENWGATRVTKEVASIYLRDIKKEGVDTLILGCTHYPLLKNVIKGVFHRDVYIVDSSLSVSAEVKEFLKDNSLGNSPKRKGTVRFFVTDDAASFRAISRTFLGAEIVNVNRISLT